MGDERVTDDEPRSCSADDDMEVENLCLDPSLLVSRSETADWIPPGPEPAMSIQVDFEDKRPWVANIKSGESVVAMSYTLYDGDYAELLVPVFASDPATYDAYLVQPEILNAMELTRWEAAMKKRFEADIQRIEDILFETRIDDDDEREMVEIVEKWAEAKNVRRPGGQTWFDAFLARLKSDTWYRDYLFTSGASHSYLDTLYEEADEWAGKLNAIIGMNSVEFGVYRPAWLAYDETGQRATTLPDDGSAYIQKTADLVMDVLEGVTSSDDSQVIADAISGLGRDEQRAVLRNIVTRDPGDYGEAWQGGMMYWLFEDLYKSDREWLSKSLIESGALPKDTVEGLAEGRGIAGKYLPYTTHKGEEAAQWWADRAVRLEKQGETPVGSYVMGSFASLWTPQTAGATVVTLLTAGASVPKTGFFAVAGDFAASRLPAWLTVTGVSALSLYGGYELGITGQKAIFGYDPYTHRELNQGERIASILQTVSGVLFMTAGFMAGAEAEATTSGATKNLLPGKGEPPLLNAGGGEPPLLGSGGGQANKGPKWNVDSHNPVTGEIAATLVDQETGQILGSLRANVKTGAGTATNHVNGETVTLVGGKPFRPSGLLGEGEPKNTGTLANVADDATAKDLVATEGGALSTADDALAQQAMAGTTDLVVADQAALVKAIPAGETSILPPVVPEAVGGLARGEGSEIADLALTVKPNQWYTLDSAIPPALPPGPQPLLLGPGKYPPGTLGAELSSGSLETLELRYGKAVADATAAARSQRDIRTIADTLGGHGNRYKGDVGELLLRDSAPSRGMHAAGKKGASNEPGIDVPMVSLRDAPEIVLGESKLSTGRRPYRIGESGMPRAYRVQSELYDRLYAIIKDRSEPLIVRIRMKAALDEGRIRWQLNEYGNVRVKIRGNDRFPGDVEVVTPINIPRQ